MKLNQCGVQLSAAVLISMLLGTASSAAVVNAIGDDFTGSDLPWDQDGGWIQYTWSNTTIANGLVSGGEIGYTHASATPGNVNIKIIASSDNTFHGGGLVSNDAVVHDAPEYVASMTWGAAYDRVNGFTRLAIVEGMTSFAESLNNADSVFSASAMYLEAKVIGAGTEFRLRSSGAPDLLLRTTISGIQIDEGDSMTMIFDDTTFLGFSFYDASEATTWDLDFGVTDPIHHDIDFTDKFANGLHVAVEMMTGQAGRGNHITLDSVSLVAIPEPSTISLILIGTALVLSRTRKQ